MAESPEYKTLVESFSSLVTALGMNPKTISDELAAAGLVPPTTQELDERKLAVLIRDSVVMVNPSRYSDVIRIFSKYDWLKDIVKILRDTYRKQWFALCIIYVIDIAWQSVLYGLYSP